MHYYNNSVEIKIIFRVIITYSSFFISNQFKLTEKLLTWPVTVHFENYHITSYNSYIRNTKTLENFFFFFFWAKVHSFPLKIRVVTHIMIYCLVFKKVKYKIRGNH